jgi:hypothetical protein
VFHARQVAGAALMSFVIVLSPRVSHAQATTAQAPGPYVFDVRGTTVGVPQTADFYPAISGETVIPARGFGLQVGGHIYPLSVGKWRIGFGVDLFLARATATTPTVTSPDTEDLPGTVETFPDVEVTQRIVSPQVSLNFGTSRGWSYLTTGVGSGRVTATAGSARLTTSKTAVSVGAGARWFVTDHVGVGFDLRAQWMGSRALFAASAGFSLK